MNKKLTGENKILLIILAICLIVLAALVAITINRFTPAGIDNKVHYIELPIHIGMKIDDARAALDNAGITYELVEEDSKTPNRVNRWNSNTTSENGKNYIEVGTSIQIFYTPATADKIIYLTFDDGPTRDNTIDILNTLDKYEIKATFFVQGQNIARYPEKMLETFDRGHKIGCHSYSHDYADIYSSTSAFLAEIDQYEKALKNALGDEKFASVDKIMRFPGGSTMLGRDEDAYFDAVRSAGYSIYDWTALTNDADNSYRQNGEDNLDYFLRSLRESLAKAKNAGKPLIVLMHDKYTMNECLDDVLSYLVSQGYFFDTLDNCDEFIM